MRHAISVVLLAAVPSIAAAAEPYVGKWSSEPSWCKNEDGEQIPIKLSSKKFEGLENSCDMTSVRKAGSTYDVALSCAAEGDTYKERIWLIVEGDKLLLVYRDRKGAVVHLSRCPG